MRAVRWSAVAGVGVLLTGPVCVAQVASAILREGERIPGSIAEDPVSGLSAAAASDGGGYAFSMSVTSAVATLSTVYGLRTPSEEIQRMEGTFGLLQQTSFEGFFGISDDGSIAYSAICTHLGTGLTSLDSVWLDDMPIQVEGDAIPTLPGQYVTFASRPGLTADGRPYWVGGFADVPGAATQNRALYIGTSETVVLKGGDPVTGAAAPVGTSANNIDFDVRMSESGNSYIAPVILALPTTSDGAVVVDGALLMAGGSPVAEGSPVPASIGGLPGEAWAIFDYVGINDAGDYLLTADTNAATTVDEIVVYNGSIILREGDVLDSPMGPVTLSGAMESGYLNADGDWAVVWDVDLPSAVNVEVLIFNGAIVLMEGDAVDFNGDDVIDGGDNGGLLADFTGIAAMAITGRDSVSGEVTIAFTADIDFNRTTSTSDDIEGAFRLAVTPVSDCICERDGDAAQVNVFDLLAHLSQWFAFDPAAECNGVDGIDVFDLLCFLECWFPAQNGGC